MMTVCTICAKTIAVDYKVPGVVCNPCADRWRTWTDEEKARMPSQVAVPRGGFEKPSGIVTVFVLQLMFISAVAGWLMHMAYRSFR